MLIDRTCHRLLAAVAAVAMVGAIGNTSASASPTDDAAAAAAIVAAIPGIDTGVVRSNPSTLTPSGIGVDVRGPEGNDVALSAPGRKFKKVVSRTGYQTFEDTAPHVDTVVQTLDEGARILEVIRDAGAPTRFDYQVTLEPGETFKQDRDGSLMIGRTTRRGTDQVMEVTGVIGAPWAVDADGRSVPARYETRGNTIRMVVHHSENVAYPVVADPTYTRGGFRISWSIFSPHIITVKMNKNRSADVADSKMILCLGIAFVPIVGVVLAAICETSGVIDGIANRYGWCSKVIFNILSRSVRTEYYRGGFCT